jgi:uncharacterized protein (TIGR03437 family)
MMRTVALLARTSLAILSAPVVFAQSASMTISCGPATLAQVGLNYSNQCSITGGTPPYLWSVDLLPLGLTYKTAATVPVNTLPPSTTPIAIQITGVPAVAGPFAYAVSVSDSSTPGSLTASQIVVGTIAPWPQAGPIISGVFGAGLNNPPVTQITPDGLVTIFGANFTPPGVTHALQASDLVAGNSLPTTMAQTCVRIGGILAPLSYVSPAQINAQVPDTGSTGTADISVVTNCGGPNETATQPVNMPLAPQAPEFLSWVQNPNGQDSVAGFLASDAGLIGSPGLISGVKLNTAATNAVIAVYGIGFGPVTTAIPAGMWTTGPDSLIAAPTVMFGGQPVPVIYAGLAPFMAGVYQLNVAVPPNIASGNQLISVQVNGVTSPAGAYVPAVNPFLYQGSAGLATVTVTPPNLNLGVGQSAQLSWQASGEISGFPLFLSGPTVWVSSNPQVALVSATGEVIGVAPGAVTITGSEGGYAAQATVTVTGN